MLGCVLDKGPVQLKEEALAQAMPLSAVALTQFLLLNEAHVPLVQRTYLPHQRFLCCDLWLGEDV